MNLIPAEEFFEDDEHNRCMLWMCITKHHRVLVNEYIDSGNDCGIQQYIKIMHPEVYVAWRMQR